MRLKSFYAKTMMEAMQMVRDTLGEDAVIVASREEAGTVRLTAAIDEDIPASRALGFGARADTRNVDELLDEPDDNITINESNTYEADEGRVVEHLTDILLKHGTPTDVMDAIISTATMMGLVDTKTTLVNTLGHMFTFAPLPAMGHRKPIMLVGAPGAGKTLVAAKMAARAVMDGLRPTLITTDTQRAGGAEQLGAYGRILNAPLLRARDSAELKDTLKSIRDSDLVIIDTGATNPFDVDDMRQLAQLAESGSLDPILVQAAGGDADDMAEIGRCFAILGVRRQIITRLDISRKIGGLLASAYNAELGFADFTASAMPSDGLTPLTAGQLTSWLMGISDKTATKSNTKATIHAKTRTNRA